MRVTMQYRTAGFKKKYNTPTVAVFEEVFWDNFNDIENGIDSSQILLD